MEIDILEIRDTPFSQLFAQFVVCKSCGYVDCDQDRAIVGHPCSRCGAPSDGALSHFPAHSVCVLMDLMQDAYHRPMVEGASFLLDENDRRLPVVMFFCTLNEVLFEHFFRQLMNRLAYPPEKQDELLDDNWQLSKRVRKLFPKLTGGKWEDAIRQGTLADGGQLDYGETAAFCQEAAEARNTFLHTGNKWRIPDDMPEQCLRHIWPLANLYVALHNQYVVLPLKP